MAESIRSLPALRVPEWEGIPHLVHGFFGRRGGASRGGFAELNLSFRVGDAADAVRENWRRVSAVAGSGIRFARAQQVHGSRVVTLDSADADAGEADAMATRLGGTALGILTADCVPILLIAPHHRVVAAVHAGWRGTLAGITQRAVAHLEAAFDVPPSALQAALGPAIGGCCYEVARRIVDELEQRWGAMPDAVQKDTGPKVKMDLRRANAAILARAGVRAGNIVSLGPCTRCAPEDYFSHRAANGPTGRQLSFVGWQA